MLDAFVGLFTPGLRSAVTTRVRRTDFAERHESATWKAHAWSFRTELQALGLRAVSTRRWRLTRTGARDATDPPPTSTSHPSP
ncbi:hypothetical protein GCM10025792_46330 [Pseudonocardia tropica]